jgi:hypothetical protein
MLASRSLCLRRVTPDVKRQRQRPRCCLNPHVAVTPPPSPPSPPPPLAADLTFCLMFSTVSDGSTSSVMVLPMSIVCFLAWGCASYGGCTSNKYKEGWVGASRPRAQGASNVRVRAVAVSKGVPRQSSVGSISRRLHSVVPSLNRSPPPGQRRPFVSQSPLVL